MMERIDAIMEEKFGRIYDTHFCRALYNLGLLTKAELRAMERKNWN